MTDEQHLTALDQLRIWFHYWNISEDLVKIDDEAVDFLITALSNEDILNVSVSSEGELEIYYKDQ